MADLFPHAPSSVKETLSFFTDVRRARTGEYRDSLKPATVKLDLGFIFAEPTERLRAFRRLRSNFSGEWLVPIWSEVTFGESNISAGAGSLSVETDADYRAGGQAIIWKSDTDYELVTVASAVSGTLTLTGTVAESYVAPVLIAPIGTFVLDGMASGSVDFTLETLQMRFVRTDPADLAASVYPEHRGYEVLTDPSVVVSSLSTGISKEVELIDNGFGRYTPEEIETYVRERATVSFSDSTYAARWARKQWLHSVRGRDAAFWLPSWKDDLPLVAQMAGVDTTMRCQAIPTPVTDMVGRSIQIRTSSLLLHREITGASIVSGELRLVMAQPVVTLPLGTKISLMSLQRFDTDEFEIEHQLIVRDFLATFSASTIEVLE